MLSGVLALISARPCPFEIERIIGGGGGRCDFIPDGSTGRKTWSWPWSSSPSREVFDDETMSAEEGTKHKQKHQQFEEGVSTVQHELMAAMDIMNEEVLVDSTPWCIPNLQGIVPVLVQ